MSARKAKPKGKGALAALKPSQRKLHGMLPKVFMLRLEHVQGSVTFAEVLTGEGKTTELDAHYPGFASGLDALVRAGLVLHWGDVPKGTQAAGRIERLFSVVRPDLQKGVAE